MFHITIFINVSPQSSVFISCVSLAVGIMHFMVPRDENVIKPTLVITVALGLTQPPIQWVQGALSLGLE
jgi:hypothetical protein